MIKIKDKLCSLNTPSLDYTSNNPTQTSLITALNNKHLYDYAERLSNCSVSYYYLQCDACSTKIMRKFYCGLPICPICQEKKSKGFLKAYEPYVKTFKHPKFMTLTLKNIKNISPDDFKRFSKHFLALKKHLKSWGFKFDKGIRVLEVTEKGKGYHLHYHLLYDGSYIPQRFLSGVWGRITGGSFIVDIRVARSIQLGFNYLSKYVNKVPSMGVSETVDYFIASKNVRVVQTFGTRFKISKAKFKLICPVCGFEQFCFCNYVLETEKLYTGELKFILSNPPPMKQKELLSYFDNLMDDLRVVLTQDHNAQAVEDKIGMKSVEFLLRMGYIYQPRYNEYKKL